MAKNYRFSNLKKEGFGNLVEDPKQISGANAKTTVVVLRVAVNSQNVDQDGEVIERAEFIQIKMFGVEAERALDNFSKGERIHFKGDSYPTEYENRNGELVEDDELLAIYGEVYHAPLPGKSRGGSDEDNESPRRSRTKAKPASRKRSAPVEEEWDDDDFDEEDETLGDDFEEDVEPARPERSRTRTKGASRSRKRSAKVKSDDGLDDYDSELV